VTRREGRPVDLLLDSLPRLTLVAGKGGVGKTTCAAALAIRAAERGDPTLLLSTDPAGTLGDALGMPIGTDPAPVGLGRGAALDAFLVDASAERRRFLERWRETIVTIIDRGTYLDADDIAGLVDAALPGADEVFAMLRLGALERAAEYARIFVDTAPTGHTLRLLDLPSTFAATIELLEAMQAKHRFMVRSLTRAYRPDVADAFIADMRAQTASLTTALREPARAGAVLVARAEPLVVAETARFVVDLGRIGIRVAAVVANAVGDAGTDGEVRAVAADVPHYTAPRLHEPPLGVDALRAWAAALRAAGPSRQSGARAKTDAKRVARPHGDASQTRTSRHADTLLAPSLTIVGGKGGVGKTTTACALAIEAARLTPGVLVVSTDPAPSVADALGLQVGDVETAVPAARGLTARQMDAPSAFREFQRTYQERVDSVFDAFVRRGVDAAADRAIIRDLLALAPPGIDELYALATLGETLAQGRFARVIVDPAPTGHLLRLLEMPALALDWSHRLMRLMLKYRAVAGGLGETAADILAFAKRARVLGDLLRDASRAGLVVVALDEPLVRAETVRLISAARRKGVAVRGVLWTRVAAARPDPLPVTPPVPQFVAPAATPPPVGAEALRAWCGQWRELPEVDV
jgi:arsenite-transporting ATPase